MLTYFKKVVWRVVILKLSIVITASMIVIECLAHNQDGRK